ncbi:MYCBP-associated protein [Thalassophryne amazonica]|uniref:MYCBP-associated protein n=1 Tax=Thalassophryne amazonica TaxID=390379 RepID=UPI001470EBBA|nr:MYCBP-associated protein [Thalassophryne amazonica]
MIWPHSILGSLDDLEDYGEATGVTESKMHPPNSERFHSYEATRKAPHMVVKSDPVSPLSHRDIQRNALQRWKEHMSLRRQQHDSLSNLLQRPVQYSLMNQDNFRETQEQREQLNQVLLYIQSGHGFHVGSEYWTLPQHYGDEISGIIATLTLRENGKFEPVTYIGQPCSIWQESGNISPVKRRPGSCMWDQSPYLQHQYQELRRIGIEVDIKKPDMDQLEVIGCASPFSFGTVYHSSVTEKEEVEKKHRDNNVPLEKYDGLHSGAILIPPLRFCGQLAKWTVNSADVKGGIGLNARINIGSLTEEIPSSHLELHNEGSTAIFYTWNQIPLPLQSQSLTQHFHFNSSNGVILPGKTKRLEFFLKSDEPGIKTELWQLSTHPILLQKASVQVTLRSVAEYQDKYAKERHVIETNLDKEVVKKMCRSMVCEMLQKVHAQERSSHAAEVYVTGHEEFQMKNQLAMLSLPDQDSSHDTINRQKALDQINSLIFQHSTPLLRQNCVTAAAIGQLLLHKLLDTMDSEAKRLRELLGLPERETWIKVGEFLLAGLDLTDNINSDDKCQRKGHAVAKTEKTMEKTRIKDDYKGDSEATQSSVEMVVIYRRLVYLKVYFLRRDLLGALFGLADEVKEAE